MIEVCRRRSIVIAAVLAALGGGSAGAQDALGTGDALDANLNPQSGGWNAPTRAVDFYRRNLLVTGNVAAGRGFRGSVGYTAAADFRGAVGSDDLFRFRADSALSAVPFVNLGTTYERLRFGQDLGLIEYRRAARGATVGGLSDPRYELAEMIDLRLAVDRLGLASSIARSTEMSAEPKIIGSALDEEGRPFVINSSSLRGIQVAPASRGLLVGLSTYDFVRIGEDFDAGRSMTPVGEPFQLSFQNVLPTDLRMEAPISERRIELDQPQMVAGLTPELAKG